MDLVSRLRVAAHAQRRHYNFFIVPRVMDKAADEIERLRREVSELRTAQRSHLEILGDQSKGISFSERLK